MRCPSCGAEGAYVGFSAIECPSGLCRHYSPARARAQGVAISFQVDDQAARKISDVLAGIDALVKALEAGNYNSAPTTLHQCKYDGSCGCGVHVEPEDASPHVVSFEVKLHEPLKFIPITFQLTDVKEMVDFDPEE